MQSFEAQRPEGPMAKPPVVAAAETDEAPLVAPFVVVFADVEADGVGGEEPGVVAPRQAKVVASRSTALERRTTLLRIERFSVTLIMPWQKHAMCHLNCPRKSRATR